MDDLLDRYDVARAWAVAVATIAGVLVVGALLFPRRVYDGFLWRYFWGPVVADGHGVPCAHRADGETVLVGSAAQCRELTGIVAEPGYTTVSTVSYAVVLLLALVGVVLLLDRLDVGGSRSFFYALVPFVFFGGALRTVEDANVALLEATGQFAVPFPWSALAISPFIYFTVFGVALAAVAGTVGLARRGFLDRYEPALAGVGSVLVLLAIGYLLWLSATTQVLGFYAIVPIVTLVGATLVTVLVWFGTERYAPAINAGTGLVGAVVVWGHTVDGLANVLILDWARAIGLPGSYVPKHVVNRAIIGLAETLQPAWLSEAIGTAWPFLLVKVAAAVFVVWVFDERTVEESPRYAIILLVAILAVGLGPGTRDFLRATFGI